MDTHYFQMAPDEWQDEIMGIDPMLRVVMNTVHPDGPRWCVVRFAGVGVMGEFSIPIVGLDEFTLGLQRGWAYVRDLENPDGTTSDKLEDMHLLGLFRDDYWRKYGNSLARAKPKLEALQAVVEENAKVRDAKVFDEAFDAANSDKTIVQEQVTFDMGRG